MNPNVAIELGYAQHALSDERVLMVLNQYYGGREFLPFNLQHHAGPIVYSLRPDATNEEIAAEQAKLRGVFVAALRGFLNSIAAEPAPAFPAIPWTTSKAVWFQPGTVLVQLDANTQYGFEDDRGVYLRIAPQTSLPEPLSISALYGCARQAQIGLLYREQAGIPHYNDNGAIVLEGSPAGGALRAATQVFRNGEIWGIGRSLLVENQYGRLIPVRLLERAFREALTRYVEFMDKLNIRPPYRIEFGAVGIRGFSLVINSNVDNPYEIYDDEFSDTFVLADTSSAGINAALLRIYERFFRVTGYKRPDNLFDFPPMARS